MNNKNKSLYATLESTQEVTLLMLRRFFDLKYTYTVGKKTDT